MHQKSILTALSEKELFPLSSIEYPLKPLYLEGIFHDRDRIFPISLRRVWRRRRLKRIKRSTGNWLVTLKTMHLGSFNVLFWVALVFIRWMFCHGSNEFVSVFMEKRESFDNNLPLTSACYNSEIENTSPIRCSSQCLDSQAVCKGILFNQERKTCKLIKCSPTHSDLDFDPGRWTLFWKTTGIYIFFKISLSLSLSIIWFSIV